MYKGRHAKKKVKKTRRPIVLLASVALLICVTIGGTLAYLSTDTSGLKNTFTPEKITTEVCETLTNETKSDVKIKNTSNVDVWIRACVVVTWEDSDGNVYGIAPVAGTDYTIVFSETDWLTGNDGFYYYKKSVAPGQETETLITSCAYTANAPEGYSLNVEIIGSGIQSKPDSVFTVNWSSSGLTVSNGQLEKGGDAQ